MHIQSLLNYVGYQQQVGLVMLIFNKLKPASLLISWTIPCHTSTWPMFTGSIKTHPRILTTYRFLHSLMSYATRWQLRNCNGARQAAMLRSKLFQFLYFPLHYTAHLRNSVFLLTSLVSSLVLLAINKQIYNMPAIKGPIMFGNP